MYTNPLIEKRADPQIYKHSNGMYYFTATLPGYNAIMLRGAQTIEGLKTAEEVIVWKRHESGEMSQYVWAPEIHFIDNHFCIYFAAKSADSLDHTIEPHKIYVLRCNGANPLTDVWVEEGSIFTGWTSFSLDATTFNYEGSNFLVWAQMADPKESNSNIYIARMQDYKTVELPAVCLSKPTYEWEIIGHKVNEGPAVIQKDSKLYLTYSASATDSNYCVGLLTLEVGANPLDPNKWKKSKMPIAATDEKNNEYGPGHNSFTISEDGKEILFVYHARDFKEIQGDPLYDTNRHTRIRKFDFVE
jgi:GH43 family beta-xylosidase